MWEFCDLLMAACTTVNYIYFMLSRFNAAMKNNKAAQILLLNLLHHCMHLSIGKMRYLENRTSQDKLILNTCTNNDISSSDDYPESVVVQSSAKPDWACQCDRRFKNH